MTNVCRSANIPYSAEDGFNSWISQEKVAASTNITKLISHPVVQKPSVVHCFLALGNKVYKQIGLILYIYTSLFIGWLSGDYKNGKKSLMLGSMWGEKSKGHLFVERKKFSTSTQKLPKSSLHVLCLYAQQLSGAPSFFFLEPTAQQIVGSCLFFFFF